MPSNESTLPSSIEERLLRAGFDDDGADDSFILTALGDSEPRHRVLALRSGTRRGIMSTTAWMGALGDESVEVRREALSLLAYEPGLSNELLDRVRIALDDEDALVVDAAIFALGEHLDARSVDRLSDIARHHDDARCRESAVAALGVLGDDRGRAAILEALDDKPPVRRRAIVALSNFEGPDIDEALAAAANDRDWQVRAAVDQLNKAVD
jgi:HEAT repeat protein